MACAECDAHVRGEHVTSCSIQSLLVGHDAAAKRVLVGHFGPPLLNRADLDNKLPRGLERPEDVERVMMRLRSTSTRRPTRRTSTGARWFALVGRDVRGDRAGSSRARTSTHAARAPGEGSRAFALRENITRPGRAFGSDRSLPRWDAMTSRAFKNWRGRMGRHLVRRGCGGLALDWLARREQGTPTPRARVMAMLGTRGPRARPRPASCGRFTAKDIAAQLVLTQYRCIRALAAGEAPRAAKMDAPPPAAIDQTTVTPSTCFLDPVWLQQVGGARADNVLAYFERSPFYETGEGLEFALERSRNPRCLSISKRRKKATGDGFDVEAYFYVLDGTIYQCPTIDALATSRLRKAGNYLTKAFGEMRAECDRLDEARRAFVEAPALASEKTPAPRSRAELESGLAEPASRHEDPKLRAFVDTHMADYPEGVLSRRRTT